MRFKVTLICFFTAVSFGQAPVFEPSDHPDHSVVRGSESEKRDFVKCWIALEWPDHLEWQGKIVDANSMIVIIANGNVWAQEILIAEIDRMKPVRGNQDAAVIRLALLLSHVSTPLTYEAMVSRFRDHQNYRYMIQNLIRQNLDTGTSYPLSVWYLALDSDEPIARDAAREIVRDYFREPRQGLIEAWANALLIRYKQVPTDLELVNDPMAEEIRLQDPGLTLTLFPLVKKVATEQRKRKQ